MKRTAGDVRRACWKLRQAAFRVGEVAVTVWQLLEPFHSVYRHFLLLLVLYEGWQIGISYSASALILVYERATDPKWWVVLFVGYFVYSEVAARLDNLLDYTIITKLDNPAFRWIRSRALQKLLDLDPAWYERQSSGVVVARVNEGMDRLKLLINLICWEFTPTTIQALLSLVPLTWFSPGASALTLACFAAFLWLTIVCFRVTQRLRWKRYNNIDEIYRQFNEYAQSHRTLVLFGQEDRLMAKHRQLLADTTDLSDRQAVISIFRYNRYRQRLLNVTMVGIRILWARQLLAGALDVPTFFFLNVVLERLMSSFWRFAKLFEQFTESAEPIRRFCKILDAKPILEDGVRTDLPAGQFVLKLQEVWFSYADQYQNGWSTIRDVSLELRPGTVVALVGGSGAGKSTLQKLLMRERDPQAGEVLLNGCPLQEWSLRSLRRFYSFVPQESSVGMLEASILDNLILAKPDATMEEVEQAARRAQLHDSILDFPKGYETLIGERGIKLSGGQKQRLALARALLADRPVLVLDEATSSVDTETESSIQAGIRAAGSGKLVVVIAHRLSTVRHADRIVVLEHGSIVEQGTHEELMERGGRYATLANPQTADEPIVRPSG